MRPRFSQTEYETESLNAFEGFRNLKFEIVNFERDCCMESRPEIYFEVSIVRVGSVMSHVKYFTCDTGPFCAAFYRFYEPGFYQTSSYEHHLTRSW